VAKRVRGSGVRNTHRPGGHPPVRSAGARSTTHPETTASPMEAGQAAVAPAAPEPAAAPLVSAAPSRSTRGRAKVKEGSLLAERAAKEYVYVGVDLRRIVVVAAVLMGTLIALWLFFTTVDPFGIY